ncbi:MAG: hypothetical protein Q8910_00235 [Bacteroidota bacterium]|nr:hypothetical protein [Bacteroidota bacterium]
MEEKIKVIMNGYKDFDGSINYEAMAKNLLRQMMNADVDGFNSTWNKVKESLIR